MLLLSGSVYTEVMRAICDVAMSLAVALCRVQGGFETVVCCLDRC